jgi:hypothetical protein
VPQDPERRGQAGRCKGATGQSEPIKLRARGFDQGGMPVAEVERGIGGQAVEVAAAVDVGHPGSVAMGSDHWQRIVVVRRKCLGQFDLAGARDNVSVGVASLAIPARLPL